MTTTSSNCITIEDLTAGKRDDPRNNGKSANIYVWQLISGRQDSGPDSKRAEGV